MMENSDGGGGTFEVTRTVTPDGCLLTLTGALDEGADLEQLSVGVRGVVVVDLDAVPIITSYGVRKWVSAFRDFPSNSLYFVRCRPALLTQFNLITKFGGPGQLLSFYAPYVCPRCGSDVEVLIDLRKQEAQVKTFSPPVVSCPSCKVPAQFDDIPQSYFRYVASAPIPSPPPLVDAFLERRAVAASDFRVEKDVKEFVTALWLEGSLDASAHFKRLALGLEGQVVVLTSGLTGVSPEGMARLIAFLETPKVDFSLARVPLALLMALLADERARGRGKVVSIRLPFTCTACLKQSEAYLDREGLDQLLGSGENAPRCPFCLGPSAAAFPAELVQRASALVEASSKEARWYLEEHPISSTGSNPSAAGGIREGWSPGRKLAGKYELMKPLGAGGMAEVFLARQTGVGGFKRHVAVKRILPGHSSDRDFVSMFLTEARVAAHINHPNVVQIYDVGQDGTEYFIAMEYVRGWNLSSVLKMCTEMKRQMPVELAALVGTSMCAGLECAHSCSDDERRPLHIVHRDVSPHNVMVSVDGAVKVTDFGIAKAAETSQRTPTPAMTVRGKLSYLAPEQIRSGPGIDARVDVFATGIVLYQCLTLEQPFRRRTEFETLQAILAGQVTPPSVLRPDLPKTIDAIVRKALASDVKERFATARAFQKELDEFIASFGRPIGAAELAAWLSTLAKDAQKLGVVDDHVVLTPSRTDPREYPTDASTVPVRKPQRDVD